MTSFRLKFPDHFSFEHTVFSTDRRQAVMNESEKNKTKAQIWVMAVMVDSIQIQIAFLRGGG